jgi:hypothetical protein
LTLEEAGVAVAPLAVLLDALGHGDPEVGDGDAVVGEADLGVLDQVADDGGVVVRCHELLLLARAGSAFGADPLGAVPGAGGLGAGGVDGVGHAVVLAGLPDDRVGVVLAAVVDGHPHPQGEGGLPLVDGLVAVVGALVGGDSVVEVEPVEGSLGLADGIPEEVGVTVGELVGLVGVVVAVAGDQVVADAAGDLILRPVGELMPAGGGWGLEVG